MPGGLLFGTGGAPHSSKKPRTTISGIERIAELGLDCMELEFVYGVQMGETAARQVAEVAARLNIKLTAHAPYYINLNAHEPEKIKASQERLLQTARIAKICGAESVIFHPAFYLGDPPEQVYVIVKQHLTEVMDRLERENNTLWVRPELMGKTSQFGSLDELLDLSAELGGRVLPGIDFAHWHARTGKNNTYDEFASVLGQIKKRLGRKALDAVHLHVSGINFGKTGERAHLNLKQSDFNYTDLLRALEDFGTTGWVICESPNLEEDAVLLKNTYDNP